MATTIKINTLNLMTAGYQTKIIILPHSQRNVKAKTIVLEISITGDTQDDALDKQQDILDELYKIKDDSKDCILEIKPETTASTYFEILNYVIQPSRVAGKDFTILPTINQIAITLSLSVDNYGYAASTALGNAGAPQATKTLPNYFDLSAIKGEIDAYAEIFMKLASSDDVHNIYYGIKSEKLIADIANFVPILEAEDQTLTNATKASDNLNVNPSIEVDTSGYTLVGSTISRDIIEFYKGIASLKCITDNAAVGEGYYRDVTGESAANEEYTFSVYLKGSGTVILRFYDDVSGNQDSAQITLNGDWTRYSLTKTFGIGSTDRKLYVITDAQQSITFYSDALMHTEGDTLYPYYEDAARNNYRMCSNIGYPTADWATYIKFALNNANYKGRYLVLVRCESESASDDIIKIRLKRGGLYNDEYSFQATDASLWRLIELGEIQVPYAETKATTSVYEIQLIGDASDRIGIDYIALIPIDECFGIRKGEIVPITQNDIYLVNTIKKIFSTYLQDVNDNNYYDRGNFFFLPKGDNRIVAVSDSNTDNKITDSVSFWLNYVSRYFHLKGSN